MILAAFTPGEANPVAIGFFLAVRRACARDHVVGRPPHAHDRAVLRRRSQRHRLPERVRTRGRLHERGQLPRHRRPRRADGFRRPDLLDRLSRRLADRALPDRRAAAQPRPLHVRRRGRVPDAAGARAHRHVDRDALGRHLLSDRPDGRCGHVDQPHLRPAVRAVRADRRRRDADVPAARRHARDDLGADRQGGAARRRRHDHGSPRAGRVRPQPARPLPDRRGRERRRGARAGRARLRALGRDLARSRAHVRHRRAAAHPDALLHRPRREGRPHVGQLGDDRHRLLLPPHLRARLRRDGARRAGADLGDRQGRERARRCCWRRTSPGRRSSASSPPSRSRRSSPSSPG